MSRRAYLLIAHGSREKGSNRAFLRLIQRLQKKLALGRKKPLLVGAFLELARPTILEGIEECARPGVREVFVVPFMLLPGRHVLKDIPHLIKEGRRRHPKITFYYEKALADDPTMLDWMVRKIRRNPATADTFKNSA